MSLVALVLKRPYTVPAVLILICLLGIGAALRMPVDIFPEIDIPVVSVVWTYNGMSAAGHAEPHPDAARTPAGLAGRRHLAHRGHQLRRASASRRSTCTRAPTSRARSRSWPAARWSCSSTCRPTSRRRWCCATAPPTCRSSSSACRATRCPTPSSTISARTSSAPTWPSCTAPRCRIPTAASRASSWPISTRRRCSRAACRPPT